MVQKYNLKILRRSGYFSWNLHSISCHPKGIRVIFLFLNRIVFKKHLSNYTSFLGRSKQPSQAMLDVFKREISNHTSYIFGIKTKISNQNKQPLELETSCPKTLLLIEETECIQYSWMTKNTKSVVLIGVKRTLTIYYLVASERTNT